MKTRSFNGYKQYQTGSGSWKFVHRRVAEKKIGRSIPKGHEVHHKDIHMYFTNVI